MIEPVSGASEAPSPSSTAASGGISVGAPAGASGSAASLSATASISQTLAVERALTSFAGAKEAAARHSSETTSSRPAIGHARSLAAIDDAVVRNLLDSLSPDSRVAGSFFLAESESPAQKSLFATYYEDV